MLDPGCGVDLRDQPIAPTLIGRTTLLTPDVDRLVDLPRSRMQEDEARAFQRQAAHQGGTLAPIAVSHGDQHPQRNLAQDKIAILDRQANHVVAFEFFTREHRLRRQADPIDQGSVVQPAFPPWPYPAPEPETRKQAGDAEHHPDSLFHQRAEDPSP